MQLCRETPINLLLSLSLSLFGISGREFLFISVTFLFISLLAFSSTSFLFLNYADICFFSWLGA